MTVPLKSNCRKASPVEFYVFISIIHVKRFIKETLYLLKCNIPILQKLIQNCVAYLITWLKFINDKKKCKWGLHKPEKKNN